MKQFLIYLLSVLFVATIVCCDESGNPAQSVELKNFANTGCKGFTRSDTEGSKEIVEYRVIHDGYLYISHQNAIFNCCPGELGADISTEGNTITVTEYETENGCKCICSYDLSYEVGPLAEGETYRIIIGKKGEEQKVAEFTFNNSSTYEEISVSRR